MGVPAGILTSVKARSSDETAGDGWTLFAAVSAVGVDWANSTEQNKSPSIVAKIDLRIRFSSS
jgi:hypothetical protein